MRPSAAIVSATVFLTACSGGGSTVAPTVHQARSDGRTAASFTVKWTSAASASARSRRTISPSAQSIVVLINGVQGAVANRNGNPTQTVSLSAPVGSDQFVFNVYDQTNGTGHLLGTADVQQLIVDGAANVVTAAIDAVCAATNVNSVSTDPLLFVKTAVTGVLQPSAASIVLGGQAAETLAIEPEDVDGDVIITGTSGVVNYSISGADGVTAIDGAHIAITPAAYAQQTLTGPAQTLTVAAPGCPSTTVSILNEPVAYAQTTTEVFVFDLLGDFLQPKSVAAGDTIIGYDYSSRRMIAYNASSGAVDSYDVGLNGHTLLYTIHPNSVVTWSNYLHSVFASYVPNGAMSDTFYTYLNSQLVTIASNNISSFDGIAALAASTVNSDSTAYATDSFDVYEFSLQSLAQTQSVGTPHIVDSLAYDGTRSDLLVFNTTSPYVTQYLPPFSSPTNSNDGFFGVVLYGAVETDFNDAVGFVGHGVQAVNASGSAIGAINFGLNGTPLSITTISANEL